MSVQDKVDPYYDPSTFKPRMPDYEKIKHYKSVDPVGPEMRAHERDVLLPKPEILKVTYPITNQPPPPRKVLSPDDVTDFPEQKMVGLMESRPYEEGRYRPPSLPFLAGVFPTHVYLYRGKVYDWCSCGHAQTHPWCDGQCKWVLTRNRPIAFNVSESGYYKMCNCKLSANAPFCNGTHRQWLRWAHKHHRGFWGLWGVASFWICTGYWLTTFYR